MSKFEVKYEGYCPTGQIPYVGLNSLEPPTCHMALSPCPTTAPYQCIYSAEKQNSYCCTPTGTAQMSQFHSRKLSPPQLHQQNIPPKLISIPPILIGPNGEQINKENIPVQLLSTGTLPPSLPGAPISGCPPTSQPLLNGETRLPLPCSTMTKCPESFTCYSNYPDGRNAQCCTTMITNDDDVFMKAMRPGINREPIKVCPSGFIKLGAACKRSKLKRLLIYFVGSVVMKNIFEGLLIHHVGHAIVV